MCRKRRVIEQYQCVVILVTVILRQSGNSTRPGQMASGPESVQKNAVALGWSLNSTCQAVPLDPGGSLRGSCRDCFNSSEISTTLPAVPRLIHQGWRGRARRLPPKRSADAADAATGALCPCRLCRKRRCHGRDAAPFWTANPLTLQRQQRGSQSLKVP
jgi:hypothetical protein